MPSLPDPTLPNLQGDTEHVRRDLYDRVNRVLFAPPRPEQIGADDYTGPDFDADDAGLTVFRFAFRWFATWTTLDEPESAPRQRSNLVRIDADPSSPHGIALWAI